MTNTRGEVDLVRPVERAMRLLSTVGLDFYDVSAVYSRSLSVTILGRGVKDTSSTVDVGIGVRAFNNRGMGSAFSQSLDITDVETTVRRAASFAKVAQPDPYFRGLPDPSKASEISGLCDREVVSLSLTKAGELSKSMIDATEAVRAGAMYQGGLNASHSMSYLTTSTGVAIENERTIVSTYIAPTYRVGDDVGSSSEFEYGISLAEIDFGKVGRKAGEKAVGQLGSKRIESASLSVILAPESTSSLLFGLMAAASGEAVVKGRTFASGLLGRQVASDVLDVYDDGTLPGAVASNTYDGEGVPTRPTMVVSKGKLLTFLHNSYSAGIAGVETNAHAQRGGYGVRVGTGPTNVKVKPGDISLNEMIAETRKGVLVTSASFFPNIVSGEFSSTIDEGFLVENGEKKHAVKNLMAGGHALELYKNVELTSKEGRTFGKGHFFPSIRVSSVRLSGD